MDLDSNQIKVVRLGMSTPEERQKYESKKAEVNKGVREIRRLAQSRAKGDKCFLCHQPCTSFCNSHSIPEFVLKNAAESGSLMAPLQFDIPTLGKDFGVRKAGTFHLICESCDNKLFKPYENPDRYKETPNDNILALIAIKNCLFLIGRKREEYEIDRILKERFFFDSCSSSEKTLEEIDLDDLYDEFHRLIKTTSSPETVNFSLCFYTVLDYIVPYASQAAIAMVADFDDKIINDLFKYETEGQVQKIHIAVFPLKQTSVIMMFFEINNKRYYDFCSQFKRLDFDDQLAAINYILFAYTDNIFMHPKIHKELQTNTKFMDVCKISPAINSPIPFLFDDPMAKMIQEYSLSRRHEIPNLLSRDYAIKPESK